MNKSSKLNPEGFTQIYGGRQREITTDCYVVNPLLDVDFLEGRTELPSNPNISRKYKAVWDTGATRSSINIKIVKDLGLSPINMCSVIGVTGREKVYTYYLVIRSPHKVYHFLDPIPATKMEDEVLIGMDVISRGDFVLIEGNLFSYCYPSFRNPIKLGNRIRDNLVSQGISGVSDGNVSQFYQ